MPMRSTPQHDALTQLEHAIRLQDGELVEAALIRAFGAGLHDNLAPCLIILAEAPWHMRHEDVVSAIQHLRVLDAVQALERLALTTYSYLAYDEFFGLARKCTWALADIGSSAAYDALVRLTRVSNPIIAGYATKRILSWHNERHRKRGDP